jgi:hypothetical protein
VAAVNIAFTSEPQSTAPWDIPFGIWPGDLNFCRESNTYANPLEMDFFEDPCDPGNSSVFEALTLEDVLAPFMLRNAVHAEEMALSEETDGIKIRYGDVVERLNLRDRAGLTAMTWQVSVIEDLALEDVVVAPVIVPVSITESLALSDEWFSGRIGPFASLSNADVCTIGLTRVNTSATLNDTTECDDNLAEKITLPKL